jgi:hypothetical protein
MTIDYKAKMAEMAELDRKNNNSGSGCKDCDSFMYTSYFKELHPFLNYLETWDPKNAGVPLCPDIKSWVWMSIHKDKSTSLFFHVAEYSLLEKTAAFYNSVIIDEYNILPEAIFTGATPRYFIPYNPEVTDIGLELFKLCTCEIVFAPDKSVVNVSLSLGPLKQYVPK